ncbi:hypothetical protein GWI33_002980, partial [Rhynchophorus ferrugineus]
VGDESAIRIDSPPRRSRLSSTDSSRHGASDMSITDSTSHISDHSPLLLEYLNLATPHLSIKRKSVHNRKLRPKSVVDSVEGLSADDIPSLLPSLPRNSEEEDSVTELPNTSHHLQHLVKGIFLNKGRPRRAKTRAPTRPVVKPPDVTDLVSQDLVEGLDTFFRPGSVTPTSDDCHSFHLDGSPNHEYSSPILSEDRKTPKLSRNSPLLRGLMTPTPRSRSTDNLEKCSPSMMRKNAGDSPLSRRLTGDSLLSQESSEGSLATESTFDHSPSSTLSKRVSPDSFKENSDPSKLKLKPTPAIAQKPRPWSMVNNTESKSADLSLLSDGSSPNNSTGNTPDSAEALDSSESSSIDRKIAKDIKLKRSGILQSYFPDRGDFKFLSRYKGIITKPGQSSSTNQERRDSNFNCSSREDAHTVR